MFFFFLGECLKATVQDEDDMARDSHSHILQYFRFEDLYNTVASRTTVKVVVMKL